MNRWHLAWLALAACGATDFPVDEPGPPLTVGESRDIELRYVRFDVSNYEKALTKADLLALPQDARERMWLLDLDVSNGPSSPKLIENTLTAMRSLDPATLDAPSRNLQKLLTMTPDTAELRGTKLEGLLELAPLVGIPPANVFAQMLGVNVEDTFISPSVLAQTLLSQVIETHPNTRTRLGPKTADNPDGIYPVPPGTLSVTLEDVVTDGATLGARFGEVWKDGEYHPGFLAGDTALHALQDCPDDDCFRIVVKVTANALPYKGVDLTNVSSASVNSVPSQIDTLFDFEDPNWLTIEGLADVPTVKTLTFVAKEADGFIPGGTLPVPYDADACGITAACGNSPGWQLPPYTLERVLLGAASRSFSHVSYAQSYYTTTDPVNPLMTATVDGGWATIDVKADLGAPPPPAYLWDVLLEAAQVVLHDGVAENDADVAFTLHDIPLGVDRDTIQRTVRDNLAGNPEAFLDIARRVIDTSSGEADFYYYIADPRANDAAAQGDYLVFIAASDLPMERPYTYAHPGFYADEALTEKLSTTALLDHDSDHEKIKLADGEVVYAEDNLGQVFRIEVGAKPSERRRDFTITRVK